MPLELHVQLFIFVVLFGWGFALAAGDPAERAVTIVLLVGALLSVFALPPMARRFAHLETGVAVVDGLMLIALVATAHHFRTTWLLCMAALQLMILLSHFPILMGSMITPEGYILTTALWSWLMMLLLIGVTTASWWRRRRLRTKRSSSSSSNP